MKILVLSDSHGDASAVESAVLLERPDAALHLGDGASDMACAGVQYAAVRGNCDFRAELPDKRVLTLGGVKLFMTHGHMYGVKQGYMAAVMAAREAGADVLLFGHTHFPMYDMCGALHVLNPGSVRQGRYAVLEAADGRISCRLKSMSGR